MGIAKLGIALSGGGSRGFAHIGVLKVLEQAKIPIRFISGTSMGGVIAAAYASGMPISQLEDTALKLAHVKELIKLLDISPARRGLLEGTRVRNYLRTLFSENINFEDLIIPLALNAVDIITGKEITFTSGPLFPALLATCAVPGIFPPVEIDQYRLVDGGVLTNIPTQQVKDLGSDLVIAVNAQIDPRDERLENDIPIKMNWPVPLPEYLVDLYWAGFIMVSKLSHQQLDKYPPNVYIYPRISSEITMFFGFTRVEEVIKSGEVAALEALPSIYDLL